MARAIARRVAHAYWVAVRILLSLVLAASVPVTTTLSADNLEQLRAIDLRLATIAQRLVVANAALCTDRAPATGAVLHAITQYDAATAPVARQVFGFVQPLSVEAVVPDSPAARAGLRANDGIVAIDGMAVAGGATPPSSADRDAALARLAKVKGAVRFRIDRSGRRSDVSIDAPQGCRATFEVLLGPEMAAHSDGRIVQIGVRFFERYRDEETAVIVAHELAHIVMRHRVRLAAAGVKGGLLGEIGRNARLGQRAENEADALGVALLYNAGYDPASAARFWRDRGGDIDGGLFRSRTHPATAARIKAIEAAATAIPAGATRPYTPSLLATRDAPF